MHYGLRLGHSNVSIDRCRVQYYELISSKNAGFILYVIVKLVYFPNAVYFSHEAYKKFKHFAYNYSQSQSFGDYQMMPLGDQDRYQQQSRQDFQQNTSKKWTPFSGNSVAIG